MNTKRVVSFIGLVACLAVSVAQAKPNIVLIMADDVGPGDIGRQHTERTGQPALAPTPTLDTLANEGMWFDDAHSPTSLCAPSRYAVMSGNYNYRSSAPWGVWNAYGQNAITASDTTLARITKRAGYYTGFVGKWHLGGDFRRNGSTQFYRGRDEDATAAEVDLNTWVSGGPSSYGFDWNFTVPTGVQGPVYLAYLNDSWDKFGPASQIIHLDENTALDPLFVSDKGPGPGDSLWSAYTLNQKLASNAVSFIQDASSRSEPFFLCYWSPAVHIPHAPEVSLDGEPIRGTTPTYHLDMNRVLDWEVSKIVDALKSTGEYNNTVIIFTSDNGGLFDWQAQNAGHNSNGGLVRGHKNSYHEGGHLVPLIVTWPGVVAPNSRSDHMINGTDFVATIASIAGVQVTSGEAKDSHDFSKLLKGDSTYQPRSELILQSGSAQDVMFRQGDWKLVLDSNFAANVFTPIALYNLQSNPGENESGNLVNDPTQATRVQTMRDRYLALRNSPNRTSPINNPGTSQPSVIEVGIEKWTQPNGWKSVSLQGSFTNPVIIMGPPSFNGADPSTVRVRNITPSGFEFTVDEWDYLDGDHWANEDIPFIAIEAGRHVIGGRGIEAGFIASVTDAWQTVSFESPNYFGGQTVLTQVVTNNDPSSASVRMRNITAGSFDVRLQKEQGAAVQTHGAETVAYLAAGIGFGTENGTDILVGNMGTSVTHEWSVLNFGRSISGPAVFAQITSFAGGDTSALRSQLVSNTSVELKVEEEASFDAEVNHVPEEVRYLIISTQ
ncbi:MAG: arylsulfatase [Verrucomicrobiota bacterium]